MKNTFNFFQVVDIPVLIIFIEIERIKVRQRRSEVVCSGRKENPVVPI